MGILNYLDFFIGGMLGFGLSIGVKMNSLRLRDKAANMEFSPIDFFKQDWLPLIIQFWVILIALYLVRSFVKIKPEMVIWLQALFFCVGYMGSSLLLHALSRYEKKALSVIDIKTNIADKDGVDSEKNVVKFAKNETPDAGQS